MKLFDDYADNEYETDSEDGDSDREIIEAMLKRAKLKFSETSTGDFEEVLELKNGVGFSFDEDGALLYVIQEVQGG